MKFEKKNTIYVPSLSTGSLVHTNTCFENCRLAGEAIGERGKKAEEVGRDAAVFLKKQLDTGAPVDEHMADQLLPFMALASSGKIHVAEITNHAKTNISVIEKFLDVKFIMDEKNKIIKM